MKIVYIAHPISGDVTGNLAKIKRIVREINLTMPDVIPFAHYVVECESLYNDSPEEKARGISNDNYFLRAGFINEIWLYGNRISDGMRDEVILSREMNIPVIAMTYQTKRDLKNI